LPSKPNWSDFFPNVIEELPPMMPEALGKSVQAICFADADYAGDLALFSYWFSHFLESCTH
jgi:hypothetical protein